MNSSGEIDIQRYSALIVIQSLHYTDWEEKNGSKLPLTEILLSCKLIDSVYQHHLLSFHFLSFLSHDSMWSHAKNVEANLNPSQIFQRHLRNPFQRIFMLCFSLRLRNMSSSSSVCMCEAWKGEKNCRHITF